jgi:arsenate reductase
MAEAGVDISGQRSKGVDEIPRAGLDWVITVCNHAAKRCPTFPGPVQRMHAGFDDPPTLAATAASAEQVLSIYRRVRDEIRAFVEELPRRLRGPETS